MADTDPTTDNVIDLRLLQRHVADIRLRVGHLEGRANEAARDIRLLLVMAQNHDESLKDIRAELGEMIGMMNTRFGALEETLLRIERRLEER